MASFNTPKVATYRADAAISRGMAVKIGSDNKHVAKGAANTDRCIGIAMNDATTLDDAVEVALPGGGAPGLLGESSVVAGNYLVAKSDGTLEKANTSGDHVVAKAMQSGASGEIIEVEVVSHPAIAAQS